jgi:hypothetical protein
MQYPLYIIQTQVDTYTFSLVLVYLIYYAGFLFNVIVITLMNYFHMQYITSKVCFIQIILGISLLFNLVLKENGNFTLFLSSINKG